MSMEIPGGCSCFDRIDVFLLCFFLSLRFIFHGYSSSLPRANTKLLLRVFVTCSSPEIHTIFTPYMVLTLRALAPSIYHSPSRSYIQSASLLFYGPLFAPLRREKRFNLKLQACVNPIQYRVAVASGPTLRSSSSQDPRSETRKPQIRWSSREFAV